MTPDRDYNEYEEPDGPDFGKSPQHPSGHWLLNPPARRPVLAADLVAALPVVP